MRDNEVMMRENAVRDREEAARRATEDAQGVRKEIERWAVWASLVATRASRLECHVAAPSQ